MRTGIGTRIWQRWLWVLDDIPTSWYDRRRTSTRAAKAGAQAPPKLRDELLETATTLFRRRGFVATTVDDICAGAGATKGAFFHHFESKEALALACLVRWNQQTSSLSAAASLESIDDPVQKALTYMDFFIGVFSDPELLKSCLAGTTAQELSESHPQLRDAANVCFTTAKDQLRALLDDACRSRRVKRDTDSLATLWIAALQGSLVLCKASRDESVIPASLQHVRTYIASQISPQKRASPGARKR
jgi:TetR/AcrR family transcriptional repressor of nem operon